MSGRAPIRVVLADDNIVFRQGLRAQLSLDGFDVVGEASDGRQAVRLVSELLPDLVIMDTEMPVLDGIEATRSIALIPGAPPVLVMSDGLSTAALDAMLAGARGLLLKTAEVVDIVRGARQAAAGQFAVEPAVTGMLVTRMRELEQEHTLRRRQSAQARLTHREEDVLRLIAMGRDNPDIGAELFISSSTVKRHVGTILAKLEVCNRVQAAAEAVRIGIA